MAIDPRSLAAEMPGLLRYGWTLTRDRERAEDLVQATLVRALERRGSFRGEAALGTWLRRILHNIAVDEGRRSREDAAGDLRMAADEDAQGVAIDALWANHSYTVDAAAVLERAEVRQELQDGLTRLPVIYRSAVVLHDVEGLTAADIAAVHGIGLPAAKQRLRRGRMMLVSALADGPRRRQELKGVPMKCWDARLLISDYLDGALPPTSTGTLERHLRTCPTCPPLYAAVVGVRAGMGDTRDPNSVVPADVARKVFASLKSRPDSVVDEQVSGDT